MSDQPDPWATVRAYCDEGRFGWYYPMAPVDAARAEVERRHAEEVARWEATVAALQKTVAMLEEHIAEDGHAEEIETLKADYRDLKSRAYDWREKLNHEATSHRLARGWYEQSLAEVARLKAEHAEAIAAKDAEIKRLTHNVDVTIYERDFIQRAYDAVIAECDTLRAQREENARLRTVLDTLPGVTAQLRHAYAQAHGGRVSRRGMRQFADGLLAPQIRKLESACLQQSISNQPSADTLQSVRALYRDDRDAMAEALIDMRATLEDLTR